MDGKQSGREAGPPFQRLLRIPEWNTLLPLRSEFPGPTIISHFICRRREDAPANENTNVPEAPLAPLPLPSLPSHLPPSPCFQNMSLFITGDIAGWARLKQVMIFFPAALRTLLVALRGMREALLIRPFITLPALPARHSAV